MSDRRSRNRCFQAWAALAMTLAAGATARAQPADPSIRFGAARYISQSTQGVASIHAVDLDGDGDIDILAAIPSANAVVWFENDGMTPPTFTERVVRTDPIGVGSVGAADIDGDGHVDIVVASAGDNRVLWLRNDGRAIPSFDGRLITNLAMGVAAVFTVDIDGDGDIDVLSASAGDGEIDLYDNSGGTFPTFITRNVDIGVVQARAVHAADLDGDGDPDVIAGGFWHQNDGARPPSFTRRPIDALFTNAASIFAADLDGDGDLDLLSEGRWFRNSGGATPTFAAFEVELAGTAAAIAADLDGDGRNDIITGRERVTWHRNDGAPNPAFEAIVLSNEISGVASLAAADLDLDGDLDVIAASATGGGIAWFRNEPATGPSSPPAGTTFATRAVVTLTAPGARGPVIADIDGDGDADIVAALAANNEIALYENDGQSPPTFAARTIADAIGQPQVVIAIDFDGDDDIDLVTAGLGAPSLAWWENDGETPAGFTRRNIIAGATGLISARAVDIDLDGDLDVAAASTTALFWAENLGGDPPAFQTRTVATGLRSALGVSVGDIDGDGDFDLISVGGNPASSTSSLLHWLENDGARPPVFTARSRTLPIVLSSGLIQTADADGDGDLDVFVPSLGGAAGAYWLENDGGRPPTFVQRPIPTGSIRLRAQLAADANDDGRVDLITAGSSGVVSQLTWSENDGRAPPFFHARALTPTGLIDPSGLAAGDLDGDGDADIVMTSALDGRIAWFQNLGAPPSIALEPRDRIARPGSAVEFHVGAVGLAPLSFQWFKGGAALADGARVQGAQSPILLLTDLQAADAGAYHCVVANPRGQATSRQAALSVVVASNDAALVGHTLPAAVAVDSTAPFTVTMRNTGELTWSGAQGHALAVVSDDGGLIGGARIGLPGAGTVVAMGETAIFSGEIRAPATPGLHALEFRAVEEFVEFFGPTLGVEVTVVEIPTVAFATAGQQIAETGGLSEAVIQLGAPTAVQVAVTYATVDGSAVSPDDFESLSRTIRFAPGQTVKRIGAAIVDDDVYEGGPPESFRFVITGAVDARIGAAEHVVEILDDEAPPELSFVRTSQLEGEPAGFAEMRVTATRPSSAPTWAQFTTEAGTATAGLDFEQTSGTVFFAPGVVEQLVRVAIIDDPIDEFEETFTVTLFAPVGATLPAIDAGAQTRITIVDDDEDVLDFKLIETWDSTTTGPLAVGPIEGSDAGFVGFDGGWIGPDGAGGGEAKAPAGRAAMGVSSSVRSVHQIDPLTELHLRAATIGGSMRVQRTAIPDPLAIDATAPLGNALLAAIDPPIDDDAVTSVGIELRWFVGALTPDGTVDFPIPGGEALAPLSTLTVSLGAAAGDVGEAPLSLPGSIAGRSSLAFRINNERTGDGGARPRLEFAVNDATFGDLDGLFMLGHRLNVGAAAAPEGIGEALQGPLAANEGEEYVVRVEFRKLGFNETEIAYEVEAVDGEGTLATDGKRRLTVPAAFPQVRAIDELAIVFGAAMGFGDGPGGAIDDALDAGEQGSWIDDIRVTTFGAQSPPRLSARHWTIYR